MEAVERALTNRGASATAEHFARDIALWICAAL